jgi:insulysin
VTRDARLARLLTKAMRGLQTRQPRCRYSRFFTGSLETLGTTPESKGIDVHAELVDFYKREYSGNRMKLAVLGRQSLDELEALVEAKFAGMQNKGALEPCLPLLL